MANPRRLNCGINWMLERLQKKNKNQIHKKKQMEYTEQFVAIVHALAESTAFQMILIITFP